VEQGSHVRHDQGPCAPAIGRGKKIRAAGGVAVRVTGVCVSSGLGRAIARTSGNAVTAVTGKLIKRQICLLGQKNQPYEA